MTDFLLDPPAASGPAPARGLLSRLARRHRAADEPVTEPAPVVVIDAPAADSRTGSDLTCSWPSFVKGGGLETLRWMDTPQGPCLVGSFSPPVPRSLR